MYPINQVAKRRAGLLCILLFICSQSMDTFAQVSASSTPPADSLTAIAREIINETRFCALITVDAAGQPRVRAMDAFAPESDMTVWFATNPKSRKVEQIKQNPRVTLYYFDAGGASYVSLYGTARLVDDPKEKAARWKEEWQPFYADRDQSYLLIKVTPTRLEVLSMKHGIDGDPETWTPPGVEFKDKS